MSSLLKSERKNEIEVNRLRSHFEARVSCQGWPRLEIRSRSSHSGFELASKWFRSGFEVASKQEWLLRLRNPPVNLALLVLLLL